jgi:hypothetical protein
MPGESLRVPREALMWGWIAGAALAAGLWATLRRRRQWREHADIAGRLGRALEELGARSPEEGLVEFEGRKFQVEAEPPKVLGRSHELTVAMFTDQAHEFYLRRAGGLPGHPMADDEFYRNYSIEGRLGPPLDRYLKTPQVREILSRVLPGRWRTFAKAFVVIYFSGNEFDARRVDARELGLAFKALRALDLPIEDPPGGGTLTFRSGFEADVPPWHWTAEAVRELPPNVKRAVVSYYRDNAYLNVVLVDLFRHLAGASRKIFLSDRHDLGFLRHAYGDAVRLEGGRLETDRLDAPAAADQYLDGGFFSGFVAVDSDVPKDPLRSLADVKFCVRRLLDDEASWFSGEYEILSVHLTEEEIAQALEKIALKYDAGILPLERRFTVKLFRDERFEYAA